jgi:hypothetical protein
MKGLKEYFRLRDIYIYRIQTQINSNKEIFKYNNKATRFITPYFPPVIERKKYYYEIMTL